MHVIREESDPFRLGDFVKDQEKLEGRFLSRQVGSYVLISKRQGVSESM